jgi:hypothetical protein
MHNIIECVMISVAIIKVLKSLVIRAHNCKFCAIYFSFILKEQHHDGACFTFSKWTKTSPSHLKSRLICLFRFLTIDFLATGPNKSPLRADIQCPSRAINCWHYVLQTFTRSAWQRLSNVGRTASSVQWQFPSPVGQALCYPCLAEDKLRNMSLILIMRLLGSETQRPKQ